MSQEDLNDARLQLHLAQANLYYLLELSGDNIAKKNGWTSVSGLDAVKYFLMQKHHWTPAQLDALSLEHLRFAMLEEKESVIPPRA